MKPKTTESKHIRPKNIVYESLLSVLKRKKAGYFILIDPDEGELEYKVDLAVKAEDAGADAILIGGSLILKEHFDNVVQQISENVKIPVILFPASANQLSQYADAVLFHSLISGRNPNFLIEEHVKAAPFIYKTGLEAIPTGYMLIESGKTTSVEFMSRTQPIPRDKPDIAVAHALAGQYLGLKLIYAEAGSGAVYSIPEKMIAAIKKYLYIPLIVGGGIRTPEEARKKVSAGADFIVTGTVIEKNQDSKLISEFAEAIHGLEEGTK